MAIVNAVPTEDALKYWPQFFGWLLGDPDTATVPGTSWNPQFSHFKVGEGGWEDPGTGATARTPAGDLRRLAAPLIQDIDIVVDSTRAAGDKRYPDPGGGYTGYYQKAFILTDFTFEAPGTIKMRCFLDFGEFNDDGAGNSPDIWEIGIFSDHPTEAGEKLLVAYGTFAKQVKNIGVQLENFVRVTFAA